VSRSGAEAYNGGVGSFCKLGYGELRWYAGVVWDSMCVLFLNFFEFCACVFGEEVTWLSDSLPRLSEPTASYHVPDSSMASLSFR
jgi:hypothetical protein